MQKSIRTLASWLLLLLALVPIVMVPNVMVPTLNGKILIYRGIAFITTLFLCLLLLRQNTLAIEIQERWNRLIKNSIFRLMVINIGLLLVSTIFAHNKYVAFFGEPTRGEGFLTLFTLFVLYVGITLLFAKKEWNKFFILTGVATIIIFVYEVWQWTHGVARPESFIGNPIFLAAFYLFSLFAAHYLYTERTQNKKRLAPIFAGVLAVVSILGILIAQTRGTLAGMAVATFVCIILACIYGKDSRVWGISVQKAAIMIGSALVLFLVIFGLTIKAPVWQKIPGLNRVATSSSTNIDSRLILVQISLNGFAQSPIDRKIVGWGWDNYRFFWDQNYDPTIYYFDRAPADRSHNRLADQLIMTGILGLLAYLALWIAYFRKAFILYREKQSWGLALIFLGVSYFVHNLFVFDTPVILFSFYAILGFMTYHTVQPYEKK